MTKGSLAVIIPAYKSEFLDKTLDSLYRQTDKNFTVYIGDDASPYPIWNTVSRWTGRLKIIYRRFEDNLGGTSLTAHWNRCLDMTADEEFFCMFSDDDIMEENCVAAFRKALKKYPNHDVYHFDISIIRSDGSLDRECNSFPAEIAADEFFARLYMKEIDARMPEFIFRTDNFRKCGGFVEFKKAFRSAGSGSGSPSFRPYSQRPDVSGQSDRPAVLGKSLGDPEKRNHDLRRHLRGRRMGAGHADRDGQRSDDPSYYI